MNPVGFLALAIKPDIRQHPTSAFGGLMAGSFTLTRSVTWVPPGPSRTQQYLLL